MTPEATVASTSRLAVLGPLLAGQRQFSRPWLAFIVLCLLGGASLRLVNLGKYGFWTDEYFHVFAAKSLINDGTLFVPMVGSYTRTAGVTYATAAMFKVFGESEWAARFPFALAGILGLVVIAVVVRRLFSETVSATTLFGLAFIPFSIDIARECRFYTFHQLFYFGAAAALFAGFENVSGRQNRDGRKAMMDWRWIVASIPLGLAALHFQTLTVNLGVVAIVYAAAMFVVMGVRQGWARASFSKYGVVLVLAALAIPTMYVVAPEVVRDNLHEVTRIENWQISKGYDSRFYRFYFTDHFPALTFLFPVGMWVAVRRYGKAGLFAVCASAPLLILHSYVFARKSERYIFYLFPFFLIVAAIALEPIFAWGWERLRVSLKSEPLRAKVVASAFLLPGFLVITHPWAFAAFHVPFRAKHPDWKSLDVQFKSNLLAARVITTNPQAFLYYVGKYPEYYRLAEIRRHKYENVLIQTEDEFSSALRGRDDIYFVGAEWNFHNEAFMTPAMRNAVEYLMAPVDHRGDRRILAYHK